MSDQPTIDLARSMNIPWIKEFLRDMDVIVHERFENVGSLELKQLLLEHYRGGKRLRPIAMACGAALGTARSAALPHAAAAMELLHMASLFHDDLLDGSRKRRDHLLPTDGTTASVAILAGDFLIAEAVALLAERTSPEVVKSTTQAMKRMVHGEIETLKRRHRIDGRTRDYLRLIADKTAVLFAASCATGIRLSSADQSCIDRLAEFGHDLGMAYQLTDDMEDLMGLIEGGEDDAGQGYYGLPIIELWQKAGADHRDLIRSYLHELTDAARLDLLELMNSFATLSSTRALAHRHVTAALYALQGFKIVTPFQREAMEILRGVCGLVDQKCGGIMREYERRLQSSGSRRVALADYA